METNSHLDRFVKVFSSLPLAERANPVVVLEGHGPISWERAYKEMKNGTEAGEKIAEKLVALRII